MVSFRKVCVFCGSNLGYRKIFSDAALNLGQELVKRNMDLVYGGGSVGLMGLVSQTVFDGGCKVLGVIPTALIPIEISGEAVGDVLVVSDMHERKAEMARGADAFIALPGGYGTMEELLEIITWSQLGIHSKPRRCEFFVWDDHELNDWYKRKVNEAKKNVELLNRECGELQVRLRVAYSEVEAKKRALVDAQKNLAMLEASEKEKTELMVYADREIAVLKMKVETLEDKNKKMKKLIAAGNEKKKKSVWSVRALIVVFCLAFAIAVVKLGM